MHQCTVLFNLIFFFFIVTKFLLLVHLLVLSLDAVLIIIINIYLDLFKAAYLIQIKTKYVSIYLKNVYILNVGCFDDTFPLIIYFYNFN